LPFTIPTSAAHLPSFNPRALQITYDLWHGYRRLQHLGLPARFPFGFGLSYGRFTTADPTVALISGGSRSPGICLQVSVANVGSIAAATVVQIYLEPPPGPVVRGTRSLVGFVRVALKPGANRRISLRIPLRRLAWFDERRDCFVVQAGRYLLVVADHAEDPGQGVSLDLDADVLMP
jgi:beta-glucosidase